MKKIICFFITAAFLLLPFQSIQAWSSFRNESGQGNANIISAKTPVNPETAGAKWQIKFLADETIAYNSDPIITDTNVYVVCKDTLYQLDKSRTVLARLPLAASMNSVCRMSLHENRLFIPLSGGTLQCVDAEKMISLWISEPFGLQSLTTTYYYDGCVYAGTTNASGTDGVYYCLSAEDGSTRWTYQHPDFPCGFYWSGAVSGRHSGTDAADFVLFGGDNGILVSHSAVTDTVYDTYDLSDCIPGDAQTDPAGKIRAGITYDVETDAYYTTSTNGYLYQIKMDAEGCFESVTSVFLGATQTSDINCTSTPTIYNSRIYVCSYGSARGQITVVDAVSMHIIYSADAPDCRDIKSSPLVSTGYAAPENGNTVYVYFTQNAFPGGIYYIEDSETSVSADIRTLFLPVDGKQFCLSSVAADSDGTLFYSNDSGTLFAIQDGYAAPPDEPSPVPDASDAPPTGPEQPATANPLITPPTATPAPKPEKTVKPGKPANIKYKIKKTKKNKYQVTFTWKKGKYTTYTKLIVQKKKHKQTYRSVSRKKKIALKKGTYTVRFYGCSDTKTSGAITRKLRLK